MSRYTIPFILALFLAQGCLSTEPAEDNRRHQTPQATNNSDDITARKLACTSQDTTKFQWNDDTKKCDTIDENATPEERCLAENGVWKQDQCIAKPPQSQTGTVSNCPAGQVEVNGTCTSKYKSFLEYCEDENASEAIQLTITELKRESGIFTGECAQVYETLRNMSSLNLSSSALTDLSPLVEFVGLTELVLNGNDLADITPLINLTALKKLELFSNKISDISIVAKFQNLEDLRLWGNQISDISPLSQLINLDVLYLGQNQITDVSPLASLTNLTQLYMEHNAIQDVTPLALLTNLVKLNLLGNKIENVAPLVSLKNLVLIDLNENPLGSSIPKTQDNCPASGSISSKLKNWCQI